jgi:glycosyltransferase involved in cell wall biosynthesis
MPRHRVVAVVEARVVSGPAKNILGFAARNRNRVDFTVVTFLRTNGDTTQGVANNQFVVTARELGLTVELVPETGAFDRSVIAALRQICDRHSADILQTHGVKSHFVARLLDGARPAWVAFHHGYTSEDFKMRLYNQCDRWSLRSSDLLVTVCHDFARQLESRGADRGQIIVIPNSISQDYMGFNVDATSAAETRRQLAISPNEKVVLAIGRLSPEKGHRHLIDAVARIVSLAPGSTIRVLIAGAGPCGTKVQEQIDELGLAKRISILGYCADVRPLFSIADLFVLPSLSEGSPNVLLESMAARVPIVASNVGGIPELVSHAESALLVAPADANALAKAIDTLLRDGTKAKQLADVAFERARLMFSPGKYDERMLSMYDHVFQRKTGALQTCVA